MKSTFTKTNYLILILWNNHNCTGIPPYDWWRAKILMFWSRNFSTRRIIVAPAVCPRWFCGCSRFDYGRPGEDHANGNKPEKQKNLMTYLQAFIIAIIEGLTEFCLFHQPAIWYWQTLMKIKDENFAKTFEIVIQLGAIMAVLLLYIKRFL